MIQDQKTQTSHPNNDSIKEVSEQDLHVIAGAICETCGMVAYMAKAESKNITRQLPNVHNEKEYIALAGKGYNFQKLADSASKAHQTAANTPCNDCYPHTKTLSELKGWPV